MLKPLAMTNRICASLLMFSIGLWVMALPTLTPVINIDYHCDSALLWINSPQADSTVYYWQGTTCGSDQSIFDTTYKVLTTGTFYLREYSTASSTWVSTSCASAIVKLSQYPEAPPVPAYAGGNLTLTSPPDSVTYYFQGIACNELKTSPGTVFPISTSGTYYFKAFKSIVNCWSTSCTDVNVIIVNALEYAKVNASGISVLPNPVVDQLKLSLPSTIEKVNLTIYDFSGREVLSRSGVKDRETINVSGLDQGNYIVRFRNNDIDQSLKIIINR
jgi:hypothetical protein